MGNRIHPTAIVDPGAELSEGVVVGPHAVVGSEVVVGAESEIGSGAQLRGPTRMGTGNRIFPFACVGFEPQDKKFKGERTVLEVGDRNVFREFCTVHRGTEEGGSITRIGDDNLFMAYTHVAHDSTVGNRTIFSNAATLAGHVEIHDDATIGAFSAVHQFCRVGRHAYIGGFSVITQDVLPFSKTVGQKPACYGLNRVGMSRKGFDEETMAVLERALKTVTRGGLNLRDAVAKLRNDGLDLPDLAYLLDFIESSERGVIRAAPGRRRARGGER